MRGANKDRHFVQAPRPVATATALHRLDLFADPTGLGLAIPMANQANLFAANLIGEQFFAQTVGIATDHTRRRRKDVFRRPIVLL